MRPRPRPRLVAGWRRWLALPGLTLLGLPAIVGSGCGGGGGAPDCSFFSDTCNPVVTNPPPTPAVSIDLSKRTVQAGSSTAFVAQSSGIDQPRFQWRRSADGGATFVDIAGATEATYTLAVAQFADDGAIFRVDVRGGGDAVLASSNAGTLLVSSLPAVTFTDGDFDPADWSADALADPPQDGPTHAEDRSATGGHPGAFRHMVHTLTDGPSSLRVFNGKASAAYDPQVLGGIHAIDYAEDCDRVSGTSPGLDVLSYAMIEQSGRRYVSLPGRGCLSLWVDNFAAMPSLEAGDFEQVDGPACGSGEACPDFSSGGAPLRFGFERRASLPGGVAGGTIEHGIDNWQFSVWRP